MFFNYFIRFGYTSLTSAYNVCIVIGKDSAFWVNCQIFSIKKELWREKRAKWALNGCVKKVALRVVMCCHSVNYGIAHLVGACATKG